MAYGALPRARSVPRDPAKDRPTCPPRVKHDSLKQMSDVKYVSRARIERIRGPLRRAFLPAEPEPVPFCVHSEIAEHYGVPADAFPAHATTIDYVVAAAGG